MRYEISNAPNAQPQQLVDTINEVFGAFDEVDLERVQASFRRSIRTSSSRRHFSSNTIRQKPKSKARR